MPVDSHATIETLTADMQALDEQLAMLLKKPNGSALVKLLDQVRVKLAELESAEVKNGLIGGYEKLATDSLALGIRAAEATIIRSLLTVLTEAALQVERDARAADKDAHLKVYDERGRLPQQGADLESVEAIYSQYEERRKQFIEPYNYYGLPNPEVFMNYTRPDGTRLPVLKSFILK